MAMQKTMDAYFKEHLRERDLPADPEQPPADGVQRRHHRPVTQQQNITNTEKFVDSMTVSLATEVLAAQKKANATVATAEGAAKQPGPARGGGHHRDAERRAQATAFERG